MRDSVSNTKNKGGICHEVIACRKKTALKVERIPEVGITVKKVLRIRTKAATPATEA